MTERRTSPAARDRVEEIFNLVRQDAQRKSRILWAIFVLMAVGAAGFTVQQWRLNDVVNQIQTERARNTLTACRNSNVQNAAIVGFISASIPPARRSDPLVIAYLKRAAQTFPQTNCRAEVRKRVPSARQ